MSHRTIPILVLLACVVAGFVAPSADAADGAFEINQACVATGCVPGDTPGFPVTTETGKKYVLTSDLTLESANTDGIVVADSATLDLNGFAVVGPWSCTGGPPVCTGSGNGFGIMAFARSTVRGGAVRGMRAGVNLQGRGQLVENMSLESNAGPGINGGGSGAIVRGCRISRNDDGGILLSGTVDAILITGNVIAENAGVGVGAAGSGLIERNTIVNNQSSGIGVATGFAFGGNHLTGNASGGGQTSGGTQLGTNVCGNDTVCP